MDAWRAAQSADESLAFKEAKNRFAFDDLLRYCVAIGNEGGGRLLLGIANKRPRPVVGTSAFANTHKIASDLLNKLHFRVDVAEVAHPDGQVLVFHIPARPLRHPLQVDGTYCMSSGKSNLSLTGLCVKNSSRQVRSSSEAQAATGRAHGFQPLGRTSGTVAMGEHNPANNYCNLAYSVLAWE